MIVKCRVKMITVVILVCCGTKMLQYIGTLISLAIAVVTDDCGS